MEVRELHSSPGMLPMFARAGVAMIPGASRLPWVGGGARDIPELTLALEDAGVDRDRLVAYDRVCGFDFGDTLPATYLHMLAFPLHLALMTDGDFPFPAIGLVHIYNRIVQRRPLRSSERFALRVWSSPLEPHRRGTQFSIHTEARVGEELVWEEVSVHLRRGSRGASEDARAPEVPSAEGLAASATWSLPGDLGRRYGSVSGDLNPIHVHPLSARVFGFRSAIAHGMWTAARCLAALEPRLPRAYTAEVAFRKPIFLPARVEFAQARTKDGMRFGVRDARTATPHLDGALTADA